MFALKNMAAIAAILLLTAPLGALVDLTQYGAWVLGFTVAGLIFAAGLVVYSLHEQSWWIDPGLGEPPIEDGDVA